MPRVAMLGRFQPLNVWQESAIRRAHNLGDVAIGIYRAPVSIYNPFTAGEVDKMLHNSFPGVETFMFNPTLNPVRFAYQLERGAGTKTVYTRSKRAAFLMEMLGFDAVYEERSGAGSSFVRKLLMDGNPSWKAWVNPANVEIVESAYGRRLAKPRIFKASLMLDLYKHGFGF